MNKKIILPTIAILALGAGIVGVNFVRADESSSNTHTTIIERLSEKFGINENDVEAVFEEVKSERMAEKEKAHDDRLNQLVANGDITEEQKQLLIAKHEELRAEKQENFGNFKDLSFEERKELKENHNQELEKWAEENGIDLQFLFVGYGQKGHHYRGL